MFKIDLQDAYFHVLTDTYGQQEELQFDFENKEYQFRVPVLPFGLNTAPRVFFCLGHTMAAYLHHQGISVIPYLDDWLIHHPDRKVLLRHQSQLLNLLNMVPQVKRSKIRTRTSSGYPVSWALIIFGSGESFPSSIQSMGDAC